jgi:hypothetical protein
MTRRLGFVLLLVSAVAIDGGLGRALELEADPGTPVSDSIAPNDARESHPRALQQLDATTFKGETCCGQETALPP